MTYRHTLTVRYGECDMQRVVFNANYWVYCDDAIDTWMRRAIAREVGASHSNFQITETGFDFMLKSVTGTWSSAVVFGDTVDLDLSVSRWGNTSFDVAIDMKVSDETRFTATITYVSVNVSNGHDGRRPVAVPQLVKDALSRSI
jgi:acyl-CoA thioester hydrolase